MAETLLFYVFASLAVGCALGVVLAKSPVGSLLFMVVSLAAIAVEFILLEAHFLGAVQIIVYAGAIMVLFLFVIMLLNLGHDFEADLKGGVFSVMSFVVVGALAGLLVQQRGASGALAALPTPGATAIDAAQAEMGAVGAIADPLFTTYVVPFEITGILLLVAIVGALALAKRNVS